jgi:hypothetical protein
MTSTDDGEMSGGFHSAPVKVGDEVVRKAGYWSPNVHALLTHVQHRGFTKVPRPVSLAEDGSSEVMSFVSGVAGGYPLDVAHRSEAVLGEVADTLRLFHDASAGFEPPRPGQWQQRVACPADIDCIGHNDLGPYNVIFDQQRVVGLIDWDFAAPSSRVWDLCYAAFRFVPLSGPRLSRAFGWSEEPDSARRLRVFTEAYGRGVTPAEVVDVLLIRLASMSTYLENAARRNDPKFWRQREEKHAAAYREDLAYVLANHEVLG